MADFLKKPFSWLSEKSQPHIRDARTEHGMGYNRAVDMLKDSLNLWAEIKRSALRYEEGGEGRV